MRDHSRAASDRRPRGGSRWRRRAFLLAAALLLLGLGLRPGLALLGRWLVVNDPLAEADAIFVHAGHVPFRALEAARLFAGGAAPEVWLSAGEPQEEGRALAALGIERTQDWQYSRMVLERQGVPAEAIRLLAPTVLTTTDEAEVVAAELRRTGGRRVILVTSKQHSRRVQAIWRRLGDPRLQAIVRHAESDPFDPEGWWRNSEDGQSVVHELFGLVNLWIGSPVRPERTPSTAEARGHPAAEPTQ